MLILGQERKVSLTEFEQRDKRVQRLWDAIWRHSVLSLSLEVITIPSMTELCMGCGSRIVHVLVWHVYQASFSCWLSLPMIFTTELCEGCCILQEQQLVLKWSWKKKKQLKRQRSPEWRLLRKRCLLIGCSLHTWSPTGRRITCTYCNWPSICQFDVLAVSQGLKNWSLHSHFATW